MAVLEVLTYPDSRLKQVARPVERYDAELRGFVRDLEETMRSGPPSVGIAAPQVGRTQRVVIVDVSNMSRIRHHHGRLVLINPEITVREGNVVGREGCLSVPDYTGNVVRAERIEITACDESGHPNHYVFEGFEARAVQHEIDHLDGLLFLDRLVSRRDDLFRRKVYR